MPDPRPDPTPQQALATREQELRTLLELSQAFGRDLDRDAILARLGYALMGQMLVRRAAAFLRAPGGSLVPAAAGAFPDVPAALADLVRPAALPAASL